MSVYTLEYLKKKLALATEPQYREFLERQIAWEEAHPHWRERNWFDRLCDGESDWAEHLLRDKS